MRDWLDRHRRKIGTVSAFAAFSLVFAKVAHDFMTPSDAYVLGTVVGAVWCFFWTGATESDAAASNHHRASFPGNGG